MNPYKVNMLVSKNLPLTPPQPPSPTQLPTHPSPNPQHTPPHWTVVKKVHILSYFYLFFYGMASLARTVASLARTVPKPFPTARTLPKPPLPLPPGSIRGFKQRAAKRRVWWDGVDGMGWTGYQKCPLIFFILCEYIQILYNFYKYTQKLSPTFLRV